MRELIKHGFKAFGVELRKYPLFRRAIHVLVKTEPKPYFVQVGANNGVDFDDFFAVVSDYDLPGVVVEPIGYYFDALSQVYKRHREITPIQVALHPLDKHSTLYRVDPDKIGIGWQHGIASFSRDHLLNNGVSEESILAETVPCMTFDELVAAHVSPGRQVDILVTDTEGFDAQILAMVDLKRIRPKVIKYESNHLESDVAAAQNAGARFEAERLTDDAAPRAGKPIAPAKLFKIGGKCRVVRENALEFRQRPGERQIASGENNHDHLYI